MKFLLLFCCLIILLINSIAESSTSSKSATDLAADIYQTCLTKLSMKCVKAKSLAWISEIVHENEIKLTDDLTILKINEADDSEIQFDKQRSGGNNVVIELFNKIDSFLTTHSLRIDVPSILKTDFARSYIPESYLKDGLSEGLTVPLVEGNAIEGRGFVKKVMIPFLLGLKFQSAFLLPLSFALIALKTWKALTLGLLSMVLSAAMVIFKFAKPKVVNYEVIHYPHPHIEHHVDHHHLHHSHPHHHIEAHPHHIEHGHIEHVVQPVPGWEPHGWARQLKNAQDLAYAGQNQVQI